MSLAYMTTNRGKYLRVQKLGIENNLEIEEYVDEIDELEVSDVSEVSKDKAIKAYNKLLKPVFVEDSGFYINGYPNKKNYPGTLVKRSGISTNIEQLLETMKEVENRDCEFISCVTYYDGEEIKQFISSSKGVLTTEIRGEITENARSRLWQVFIPEGYEKTLAEMTDEERKRRSAKTNSAFQQFIDWYVNKKSVNEKNKVKIY